MITEGTANRYSRALYLSSTTPEVALDRSHTLESIAGILKNHPKIALFIGSPHIDKNRKIEALTAPLKGNLDPTLLKFLTTLIQRGRFSLLPEISRHYKTLINQKLDLLEARLSTPFPTEPKLLKQLKDELEKIFHKQITIKESIDPRLLGGGLLHIDNKLADFSLKGKLLRLKNHLLEK